MDELLDIKESPASERKTTHYANSLNSGREPELAGALSMITRSHATETTDIGFVPSGGGSAGSVMGNEGMVSFFDWFWV